MAIELCSENTNITMMSPRISFSHDLSQSDTVPVEQYLLRSISSSSNDFDFGLDQNHESSSADELFADGKILPTEIKLNKSKNKPLPPQLATDNEKSVAKSQISVAKNTEKMDSSLETEDQKKSFWRFKRSSSLNCGSGYARSLCPLPPLSRSNSTGSASSVKKSAAKEGMNQKASSQKLGTGGYQKPPLRKSGYTNGVRVNPVLNVPSANLFGLGSIFSGNKDKSKKK